MTKEITKLEKELAFYLLYPQAHPSVIEKIENKIKELKEAQE